MDDDKNMKLLMFQKITDTVFLIFHNPHPMGLLYVKSWVN